MSLIDVLIAKSIVAVLALAACVAIEHVAVIERFTLKQRIPGILFQAVGVTVGGTLAWLMQQCWVALGLKPLIIPLHDWLQGPAYIFAVFAITDLLTYWRHRAEHRFFWPIHAVHHSPTELHAANDIGHPLQVIPDLLLVWFPLSLVQLRGPSTPVAVGFLVVLLTVYIHSPIDFHFGPLRRLVVDNRFHRIHHSLDPRHIDHNFGVGLSIWDSIFGTAYWPRDEWPQVGVKDLPPPRTVAEFLALPMTMRRRPPPPSVPRGDSECLG